MKWLIREELASLRQSLSVRDRDVSGIVCGVLELAARQKGDELEVQAIWSSFLSLGSSLRSVCERNDDMAADVLGVKQEVGGVGSDLIDLKTNICECEGKIERIKSWREGTDAWLWDLKR
jgi:hypothetical protein